MMYKVPCPTKHNGIRLHTLPNQQIGIEYQTGEPHVTMAYDSALGRSAHTVAFREPPPLHPDTQRIVADAQRKLRQVYGRDDMPKGTGIQRSKSEMKPRGSANINDEDPDEDDGDEMVTKLMSYLNDKLTPGQLSSVAAILGDTDDEDGDTSGEPRDYAQASDRGLAAREARRQALDADFDRMFPTAKLLKLR